MKRAKRWALARLGAPAAWALLRILCATVRLAVEGKDRAAEAEREGGPAIICAWHGRILYLPYYYSAVRPRSGLIDVLTSPSADGEVVARMSAMSGYGVARGSSYKRPVAALRDLARRVERGRWPGMVADGSRGPAYVAQPGAVMLARLTGAPVAPVTVAFERYWALNSWDRMIIPKPFTRGVVVHGRPLTVAHGAGKAELEERVLELERELNGITAMADTYFKKP